MLQGRGTGWRQLLTVLVAAALVGGCIGPLSGGGGMDDRRPLNLPDDAAVTDRLPGEDGAPITDPSEGTLSGGRPDEKGDGAAAGAVDAGPSDKTGEEAPGGSQEPAEQPNKGLDSPGDDGRTERRVTEENLADLVAVHRPNELGRVLILEYHNFKDVEERWARRSDNFRKDLERLYARGYRAVSLRDYLRGEIDLPAGTSPVIFTFDDSPTNQLKLSKKDGRWEADPQSAVGIMLAFAREHPDFGVAGTFFVTFTPAPFREPELWEEKLRFLVEHGFEVANHAEYHEDLSTLSDEEVRRALSRQVARIQAVLPDYDGFVLALPFGLWPQNRELAIQGEWDGVAYNHRAVLLVGAEPVHSPYDRRLDVMALPRVQAIDSEFARWMGFLDQHRYISDGDPEVLVIPAELVDYLNPEVVGDRKVFTYER